MDHLIDGGVHGLFVLGSTSEVSSTTSDPAPDPRDSDKGGDGRLPVFAGVIDPATDRVIGHAKAAQSIGVDAVVVTAPFYTRTASPRSSTISAM